MPLLLLNNWRLLFGGGLALVALLAIGVQTMRLSYAHGQVTQAQAVAAMWRSVVDELQLAAEVQNAAVAEYGRKAAEAQRASQAAQQASARLHANDDARIAALVARMPAATPDAACRAADAAILEFAK